jgi:hypothetical protein
MNVYHGTWTNLNDMLHKPIPSIHVPAGLRGADNLTAIYEPIV